MFLELMEVFIAFAYQKDSFQSSLDLFLLVKPFNLEPS
jgi:hypothetical protein